MLELDQRTTQCDKVIKVIKRQEALHTMSNIQYVEGDQCLNTTTQTKHRGLGRILYIYIVRALTHS